IAIFTQSAGVPLRAYPKKWPFRFTMLTRRGSSQVIACPTALCSVSGATMVTSCSTDNARKRTSIPFEKTPSSLVRRIFIILKFRLRSECVPGRFDAEFQGFSVEIFGPARNQAHDRRLEAAQGDSPGKSGKGAKGYNVRPYFFPQLFAGYPRKRNRDGPRSGKLPDECRINYEHSCRFEVEKISVA